VIYVCKLVISIQITSGLVSLSDEKAKERKQMIQLEMQKEYQDHMRRVCSSSSALYRQRADTLMLLYLVHVLPGTIVRA
jgi:hypothetical protein